MYRINTIIGPLFVLAMVVFLVASNVRLAFNALPLHEYLFRRHDVPAATGLTMEQLSQAGKQIRDYFNSASPLLDVRIAMDSTTRALFEEREVLHMRDVKDLLLKVYRVQEGAFIFLFLFFTLGFFILGADFGRRVHWLIVTSGLMTLALMATAAAVALLAFGQSFLLFHMVSFSNDLWQLDPYTSYLVRMFPQGFWRDATIFIGVATVTEALGIMALLELMGWWHRWRVRVARRKAPQFG